MTEFWNWNFDNLPDIYNLPLEVRKESDLQKWKRIIAILKSMNFPKAP